MTADELIAGIGLVEYAKDRLALGGAEVSELEVNQLARAVIALAGERDDLRDEVRQLRLACETWRKQDAFLRSVNSELHKVVSVALQEDERIGPLLQSDRRRDPIASALDAYRAWVRR